MEMITDGNCNQCGLKVTPGEHSGHTAHFTGAWYCHDCGALCDGPDDPETAYLLLIEEPPQNLDAVARLWSWSSNFDFPSPASVFLCLIGWEELEGVSFSSDRIGSTLGYLELSYLADALNAYADRPAETHDYVSSLLWAESQL